MIQAGAGGVHERIVDPPRRSAWHRPFSRLCTIGVMTETTNDLREKKNELEQKLQQAITEFENDTGLTVTEIVPHRLATQDSWNQLRGLKLRIELLEKS
jgi:hypothetical protein